MIFCDLSTPKDDGTFSVYNDIRAKLLELGVPENEIAFIHNAKSEVQKKDLFGKVRSGQVRILLGSAHALAPTVSKSSSHSTISTARGVRPTFNSGRGALSGRATKIRRWTFTAMSPRAPSTPTFTSLWRASRNLSAKS